MNVLPIRRKVGLYWRPLRQRRETRSGNNERKPSALQTRPAPGESRASGQCWRRWRNQEQKSGSGAGSLSVRSPVEATAGGGVGGCRFVESTETEGACVVCVSLVQAVKRVLWHRPLLAFLSPGSSVLCSLEELL